MADDPKPHHAVHARLGVSPIEGVGVFAIAPIPKGTHLFAHDRANLVWVHRSVLDDPGLSDEHRALYEAFGVVRGERIGAPSSFDLLTPGWYMNEPREGETANVRMTEELECFALRDIRPGEELTLDYATLSETGD